MKHTYSWQGTFVHLRMDEKLANAYNRAMDAWFQAQRDFEREHGRKVTVEEIANGDLKIRASREEGDAWNKVARFMNEQYKNGLVLTEDDLVTDYLELLD